MTELLSVQQMYAADRAAMALGSSGETLMEAAGRQVADAILDRFGAQPTAVLCGPGNNGGDGFVIARHLKKAGAKVSLALLGDKGKLQGEAAIMAKRWRGRVLPLGSEALDGAALVVDALFGAGLARPVKGPAKTTLAAAQDLQLPIIAVDMPSGVHGDSGQILGYAPQAAMTVTFFRPKSGHLLYPGRGLCGELRVVDEDDRPVPRDAQTLGEIVVRGNVVMDGYYNDPEATAEAMRGGWFHSGDAAVMHPDGYVEIRDRFKDVIISGGENISSVEVEGCLLGHPAVQEAAVVGMKHEKWGEAPHAFVILKEGAETTENELRLHVRNNLAHFKTPQWVSFVEDLPKTATGKVQKFVLRDGKAGIARQ